MFKRVSMLLLVLLGVTARMLHRGGWRKAAETLLRHCAHLPGCAAAP
jgi:hypothetical protein